MLRALGQAKASRALGIDISSTTVKLLELRREGDRYRVESYAVSPLPAEAVVENNVNQVEVVGALISGLVSRSKARVNRAVAAVAGSSVIVKTIAMPAGLSEQDLEAQLAVEADQYIPYPLEEVALDFEKLGPTDGRDDQINVLLAACRWETIESRVAALEASGQGEVVSQPRVITGDKQKATVKRGTEISYQEGAASGATTTAFKEAVLKLDVIPNITPDDRILLDLVVNQDSVGDLVPSGNGGFVPTIDTTQLITQVLVGNGETVVLGGVFKNEDLTKVEKVPVLGDIPYLGTLFKSTASIRQKSETLIFITPRILSEALVH